LRVAQFLANLWQEFPAKLCCAFEQSGCDELILIPSSSELDQVTLLAEAVK